MLAWQKTPADVRMFCVGGWAGTGKTKLAGRVACLLEDAGVRVAFAAPTGRAARVFSRSLRASGSPSGATTVHGLIYEPEVDEVTKRVVRWARRPVLEADLIIVDEASMLSRQLATDLLAFNVPVLAIGDHGQLPPVGEDVGLMATPHVRLETVHRQALGNPIITFAALVRAGAPVGALATFCKHLGGRAVRWDPHVLSEALELPARAVDNMWRDVVDPPFTPFDAMLLVHRNKTRVHANAFARRCLHHESKLPVVGDVIVCLRNTDDTKTLEGGQAGEWLMNGVRARVKSVPENRPPGWLVVVDEEGRELMVRSNVHQYGRPQTFKGLDEIPVREGAAEMRSWKAAGVLCDFGYCLTVHKAQGSQARSVAVLLEDSIDLDTDDGRRWLYTAATRAVETLLVVPERA